MMGICLKRAKNELRNVDRAFEEYAKDNGRFGYEFEE